MSLRFADLASINSGFIPSVRSDLERRMSLLSPASPLPLEHLRFSNSSTESLGFVWTSILAREERVGFIVAQEPMLFPLFHSLSCYCAAALRDGTTFEFYTQNKPGEPTVIFWNGTFRLQFLRIKEEGRRRYVVTDASGFPVGKVYHSFESIPRDFSAEHRFETPKGRVFPMVLTLGSGTSLIANVAPASAEQIEEFAMLHITFATMGTFKYG